MKRLLARLLALLGGLAVVACQSPGSPSGLGPVPDGKGKPALESWVEALPQDIIAFMGARLVLEEAGEGPFSASRAVPELKKAP